MVFSELAELEFVDRMAMLARSDRLRGDPDAAVVRQYALGRWTRDRDVRERWLEHCDDELSRLLTTFRSYVEAPITGPLIGNAIAIMVDHNLRSYDALHVATARTEQVTHLATSDGAFANANKLVRVIFVRDAGVTVSAG